MPAKARKPIQADLLGQAALLSEPMRCRLLLALEHQELTVGELCAALQSPQSTISRHLKMLRDQGWIVARREAQSAFYSARIADLDESHRRLWSVLRESLEDHSTTEQDRQRVDRVIVERRAGSRAFFDASAERWDTLRQELFGENFDLLAAVALLGGDQVIGDLGCGTGNFSEQIAPWVNRVVSVDSSEAMLGAARNRLAGYPSVDIRYGALEALPLVEGELDAALLLLALHHVADPRSVLSEARRVVRPGGVLVVVDMQPHDRQEYRQEMGHVWLGFSEAALLNLLRDAGWRSSSYRALPPNLAARGPELFLCRAINGNASPAADDRSETTR